MSQIQVQFVIWSLAVIGLIAGGVWLAIKRRATPEKREKRRRLTLHKTGRLGDALVDEVGENLLYYSYSIHGVHYAASQDVTALRQQLPEDLCRLIGPSGMKYATNNPANSILLCEEWSGLRSLGTPRDSAA